MGSPHRTAGRAQAGTVGPRPPGAAALTLAPFTVADAPRAGTGLRSAAPPDTDYPAGLKALRDAPARVWMRGAAVPPPSRCIAIVGSRAASPYGRAMAARLSGDLARLGWTIVSGLARGIDAEAHAGALAVGGSTLAVVPSGLDQVTPPAHDALAASIVERGTLLSEIASGPPFGRGAFVKRNRLIAALACVTIVVEAAERSGALSTAIAARALGRGLCAVPGDADRPTSRGVIALLREGARVCADASDVLAARPAELVGPVADDPASRLAAVLGEAPLSTDALAGRTGLTLPQVLAALLRMRWAGLAIDAGGGRWKRGGSRPA